MADMVTKQELEAAKIDVKNAGEAVNEKKIVNPRYGAPFKSLPLAIEELNIKADDVIAKGFYTGYATETALKASLPAVSEMRARADDTRKIWRWNRSSADGVMPVTGTWTDTGPSDVDKAVEEFIEEAHRIGVSQQQLRDYYSFLLSQMANLSSNKNWIASLITDASGKNQQEINNTLNHTTRNIRYFNNNIIVALNWVKQSSSNYLELFPETYQLNTVGTQYFNRVSCSKGRAKLIISANTDLTYSEDATDNVLSFDGLDFVILGHRQGPNSNTLKRIFITDFTLYPLKTAKMKNLSVRALTDANNNDSYIDDVGKTRGITFISYKVSESSHIENIDHYGLVRLAEIAADGTSATHFESDVTGYNNESGFYHWIDSTWKYGTSIHLKMINTPTQRGYWVGQNAGKGTNGKDILMNESNYIEQYIVDDIYAKCACERSIYIMSDKTIATNIRDVESYSAGHVKKSLTNPRYGEIVVDGISASNVTNTGNKFQSYGLTKSTLKNIECMQTAKDGSRLFVFTNNGELNLSDIEVGNIDQLFYHATGVSSGTVNISNVKAVDCYAQYVPFLFTKQEVNDETIDELNFDNLELKINPSVAPSLIFEIPINADGVKKLTVKNSEIDISRSLFSYGTELTRAELDNVIFNVRTASTLNAIFSNMLNASLSPISANLFRTEFNINSSAVGNDVVKTNIKCSKRTDTGIVKCLDYWGEFNIEIPVVADVPIAYYLYSLGAVSYSAEIEFAGSILHYFYDAALNTITEKINAGGKLAIGARQAGRITLKVTQASNYRLDIDVGQTTWTGGAGTLKIRLFK